jgi:hypothetical protein
LTAVGAGPAGALRRALDDVEAGYEALLRYAARGLSGGGPDEVSARSALAGMIRGIDSIVDLLESGRLAEAPMLAADERVFLEGLREDALRARAALALVATRPAISSALVDNLNALIHLRAALTDLFLLDEALKSSG